MQSLDATRHDQAGDGDGDGWLDLAPGWLFASIRDAVVVARADTGRIALWNPATSSNSTEEESGPAAKAKATVS